MKQKIPFKSIIAVLSVTLMYALMITLVDKCSDIYDSGLFIGSANTDSSETSTATDAPQSEISADDIQNIYTQIDWWKAGIEEYDFMHDEMDAPDYSPNATDDSGDTTSSQTATTPSQTTTTPSQTTTTPPQTTTTPSQTTQTPTTMPETTTPSTTQDTTTQGTTTGEVLIPSAVTTDDTSAPDNPDEPAETPKHDISGETLTVYDLMTGQTVTGDALTILIQTTWNEVGNFHTEAIKAQAVAAYTYIKYCNTYGIRASVALRNGASQKCINAVNEVAGEAIYYNNKYIQATYCAATGGSTTSSKAVWGNSYPYLVSVESAYDAQGGAYYGKQKTFTEDEIRNIIQSKTNITLSGDPENWFTIISLTDGSYVNEMLIDGNSSCVLTSTGKSRRITGALLRESIMGQSKLLSSHFTVSYSNGVFTFTTYGYGHGVGMSQYGAQYYANYAGWDYKQILNHYYTGVTIQ